MAFPNPDTQFKKGESGNPNGRPATKAIEEEFQTFLRGFAKNASGEEKERLEVLMARLFHDAAKGDVRATTELLNRAFGKAKQDINLGGQGGDNPVTTRGELVVKLVKTDAS